MNKLFQTTFGSIAMSGSDNKDKPTQVSEKSSTSDLEYRYSPVPSNCMACAARSTSRKHKELEAQNSDFLRGPFPSREDICYSPKVWGREKYRRSQLRIVTTNKRVKVFGEWTKEKLIAAVTDRLLQRATGVPLPICEKIPPLGIEPISVGVPYDPIIHRGFYSEKILRQLHCSGASDSVLIRAMKFGLRHLAQEDLNHFVQFGVSITVLRSRKLWKELIDESLITSLRTMGFDEKISRKIILTGILSQNEACLMQMMLAGADVSGILNWQGPTIRVGTRMIQFMRKLGIPEDVLQLVVQKGVDEETCEMLKDLGYTETEEEEHPGMHEVVVCECDLTVFESEESSLNSLVNSSETLVSEHDDEQIQTRSDLRIPETCTCFRSSSSSSSQSLVSCKGVNKARESLPDSKLRDDRNDYLRRTVMIPLAWAMAKALECRPSDPKYYIACQLVRWRHGGVRKVEMKEAADFVIARTIEMDKKLMEERRRKEEEMILKRNKEALENMPCHPCRERQQVHRVKERCWKCVKKWVPNYETCEFIETCSSCRVDLSDIINSGTSTSGSGDIRRDKDNKEHQNSGESQVEEIKTSSYLKTSEYSNGNCNKKTGLILQRRELIDSKFQGDEND